MNIDSLTPYPVISVIPETKQMIRSANRFSLPPVCSAFRCSGGESDYANALNLLDKGLGREVGLLSKITTSDEYAADGRMSLLISNGDVTSALRESLRSLQQRTVPGSEGYLLDISDSGVAIVAADSRGLFYAVQTLLQLIQKDGAGLYLPGVMIEDWPDIAVRATNILSLRTFTREYTEEFIRETARFKLNTIILHYDEIIEFEKHPGIVVPGAWTKDQVKSLIELAHEHCITVIPHLQCLGHAEYVLKHDEYSHLREREGVWTEYCSSNPETLKLYKDLCEEVLALHPGLGYFHIGGDETYFLGTCDRCKQIVAEKGKSGLFIDYINKVCSFLNSKGKTPMMWDDMLTEYPDEIDKLHKDTAIVYWDYTPADMENPCLLFRNQGYYCDKETWGGRKWKSKGIPRERIKDLTEMPEQLTAAYREYLDTDWYPRYLRQYPFLKFYRDKGFTVFGAPAVIGGEYNYCCENFRRRCDNVMGMVETVNKTQSDGMVITSWPGPDAGMSIQTAWYPLLAGAEHMWYFQGVSDKEFNSKFVSRLFGLNSSDIVWAMFEIGETSPLCYDLENNDISDIESYGSCARRGGYKEMLDRRLDRFESDPDLVAVLARSEEGARNAQQALAVLEKHRAEVQYRASEYDRLVLAAKLTQHKFQQVLLFHSIEVTFADGGTLLPESVRELARLLMILKSEMSSLREEIRSTYADLLPPSVMDIYIAQIFEGEEAKSDEYLQRLSV